MKSFGEELRRIRKEKKLSIRKLGELSGISHAYLSQIENGKRDAPKPELIKKLSDGLKVDNLSLLKLAGHISYSDLVKENTKLFDKALPFLTKGNEFLQEVVEDPRVEYYRQKLPKDFKINPAYIRNLITNEDSYNNEWNLTTFIRILYSLAREKEINEALTAITDLWSILVNAQGINRTLKYKGIEFEESDLHKLIGYLDGLFDDRLKEHSCNKEI